MVHGFIMTGIDNMRGQLTRGELDLESAGILKSRRRQKLKLKGWSNTTVLHIVGNKS